MANRKSVPIIVRGHTLVITSRLIFSHVFSLPSACEVNTKDVMKNTAVMSEPPMSGALRIMLEVEELDVDVDVLDVLELILYEYIFICFLVWKGSMYLYFQ